MLYVVLASAVVFFVGGRQFFFSPALIMQGQVWRLITWIFIPINTDGGFSGIFFTAIALYFYYFIGSTLEREWGTAKFTLYYIFGVVLNIIYGLVIYFTADPITRIILDSSLWLTPSFLNLSMFFAFAVLYPNFVIRLFLLIPIKIKWLALANSIFFLYSVISGIIGGRIFLALLPLVALLNFFIVCGYELVSYIRPLKTQTSPQVINFKKAAKQAKRDLADKPYRHKCAVCGKTDTEYPELEFRYCSQCEGYHCFCIEHINNHIHFV